MAYRNISLFTALFLLAFYSGSIAQTSSPFARSTPEMEGVSSESIQQFVEAFGSKNQELHSFMLLRHGKVIAETWLNPYRPDLKHTMYSVSKSFTATAIGFAVSENRLTVDDKVISFFPDDLPPTISPNLDDLRVKDLLTMSAGHDPEPTGAIITGDSTWVKSFLATPIVHQPGTQFLYNSACTYMLSAIIQKITGEKLIDYLRPRLFAPLGITDIDWEVDPQGINVGGWGFRIRTEDMAKFGQLFLQNGEWQGKQVLPESWVKEASTLKIVQHPAMPQTKRDSSDWEQGYCYQMWRCRNNAYRGDGAFGQYIIVMPDQDAVIVITSETGNMQDELNLVWKHLLPAFHKEPLPVNKKAAEALKKELSTAALPLNSISTSSPRIKEIAGKTFSLSPNAQFIQKMSFQFKADKCDLTLKIDSATYNLAFGNGKWILGETTKLGPSLVARAKAHFAGLPPSKIAGSYRWTTENTLELTLRYIDSPHTETFTCRFDQNNVSVEIQSSFNKKNPLVTKGSISVVQQKPVQLIIRGDDMGFSHSANEALIKAYTEGFETSIEVIVPSPWFPEAVKMLHQNPGVDVGIHLAITSEWDNVKWRPLTDCPSIKDANGYFFPMVYANKNYPGQAIMENNWQIADVEKEFRAQIEMAQKHIPNISHLSSHMNCSYFSDDVKALTQKLAKEYKISVDPAIELGYVGYDGPHQTLAEKKQSFLKMLDKLEPGKPYVFVEHPGFDNEELKAIHHIGYEQVAADRQGVTDLFTDGEIRKYMARNGVQLIGYKDLIPTKN